MGELLRNTFQFSLFMHELLHGVVAAPFAYLIWRKTKSKRLVALVFLSAYLIDVDHLVDYFLYYGLMISPEKFFNGEHFDVTQKAYVPLHGWEYLIPLGVMSRLKGWNSVFTAILFGAMSHYVFDALTQGSFMFYSIIYRSLYNFGFFWQPIH